MSIPDYQEIDWRSDSEKRSFPFKIVSYSISEYPLHHHDCSEISLVISGRGTEKVNGFVYSLAPDTLSFIPPHQIHGVRSDPDCLLYKYCILFDLHLLSATALHASMLGELMRFGLDVAPSVRLNDRQGERIRRIMDDMVWDYNHREVGRDTLLVTKLLEVLVWTLRMHRDAYPRDGRKRADEMKAQPFGGGKGGSAEGQERVRDIVQYVHQHFNKKMSLEEVARIHKVSVPYLSRMFKTVVGECFSDYMHGLRVRNAKSLLGSTDMLVTDVYLEVGFDSFRTFNRVFKEQTGMTPTEFRMATRR